MPRCEGSDRRGQVGKFGYLGVVIIAAVQEAEGVWGDESSDCRKSESFAGT